MSLILFLALLIVFLLFSPQNETVNYRWLSSFPTPNLVLLFGGRLNAVGAPRPPQLNVGLTSFFSLAEASS